MLVVNCLTDSGLTDSLQFYYVKVRNCCILVIAHEEAASTIWRVAYKSAISVLFQFLFQFFFLNETSKTLYYIRPGPLAFLEAGEAEEQVFICFSVQWIRYHDLGYNGLSFNYLLDLVSIFKENAK